MRIRKLTIRNIASIEKADIDFDNGLNDTVTGQPASIFLIAGDTGAGKTVILDAISMALYKTTPRIACTANVKDNDYTNAEGECLRVVSIEQYTRLGIAPKDECYSEVVFEGNDGKDYTARLTLGMMLGNMDRATGIRPLKHRTPKWELRIGNGDWTRDAVEQTILQAVGLDFQQFGRMAMLAQGQFANFLVGNKKEREQILEQLTNTEHFSAYGEAIQSLYRKARENKDLRQAEYDTQKPHTLTDSEVTQIEHDLQGFQLLVDRYDKEILSLDEKLRTADRVLRNASVMREALRKKKEIEQRMEGDGYKRRKALFLEWDATTSQRGRLGELAKAREEKGMAGNELLRLSKSFGQLSADLADRKERLLALADEIRRLETWVNQRIRHDELYMKAGELDLKIARYVEEVQTLNDRKASLMAETHKTKGLINIRDEAEENARKAVEEVRRRQEQIDELNIKRNALSPKTVNEELGKLIRKQQEIRDLSGDLEHLLPLRQEYQHLQTELRGEEEKVAALQTASQKAADLFLNKKEEADRAGDRLTTMKMGLDEKIRELRHRLREEHTDLCPLCGQHIGHIHIDDDFNDMLTPLEEERKKAEQELAEAANVRDKALGELERQRGICKGKQDSLSKNGMEIETLQKKIHLMARQAGFDTQLQISEQVRTADKALQESIHLLQARQTEAEHLQESINALLKDKEPYDKKRSEADSALLTARGEVVANAENIRRIDQEIGELTQKLMTSKAGITTALSTYGGDWTADPNTFRLQLVQNAGEYCGNKQLLADKRALYLEADRLVGALKMNQDSILQACPEWTAALSPRHFSCHDINKEWTSLLTQVTTFVTVQNNCDATIRTAEADLDIYYQTEGKTEQSLLALMRQEAQVAVARRTVADIDAQLRSRTDAINTAQTEINAAFASLGISSLAELPDKQTLEEEKTTVGKLRSEALEKKGAASIRLQAHRDNVERLQRIEMQLEQAKQNLERWSRLNNIFGGDRFRTLVQTYILRPLLNNANLYLQQITDRYKLTCSEDNLQLSILVLDSYNKNQVRSATVLSGGERFIISLALSLALSSLNRPDMNVNILFIDEGFGTLDANSLNSVMSTLEKLQEIAGQTNRRVGIISHREDLAERIPVKLNVVKKGEGRSRVEVEV